MVFVRLIPFNLNIDVDYWSHRCSDLLRSLGCQYFSNITILLRLTKVVLNFYHIPVRNASEQASVQVMSRSVLDRSQVTEFLIVVWRLDVVPFNLYKLTSSLRWRCQIPSNHNFSVEYFSVWNLYWGNLLRKRVDFLSRDIDLWEITPSISIMSFNHDL